MVASEILRHISAFAHRSECTDIEVFPSSITGARHIEFFLGARRG